MLAVDQTDGRVPRTGAGSHPVTAAGDAAAAGHYSYLHRELSSVENTTLSWTSAEVMSWLERSRLQHLREWCVCVFACVIYLYLHHQQAPCGAGAPLFPPCPFTSSSFPLSLFPFFHWLYLFSSFVHPFPFYQNSPTLFPGRRS